MTNKKINNLKTPTFAQVKPRKPISSTRRVKVTPEPIDEILYEESEEKSTLVGGSQETVGVESWEDEGEEEDDDSYDADYEEDGTQDGTMMDQDDQNGIAGQMKKTLSKAVVKEELKIKRALKQLERGPLCSYEANLQQTISANSTILHDMKKLLRKDLEEEAGVKLQALVEEATKHRQEIETSLKQEQERLANEVAECIAQAQELVDRLFKVQASKVNDRQILDKKIQAARELARSQLDESKETYKSETSKLLKKLAMPSKRVSAPVLMTNVVKTPAKGKAVKGKGKGRQTR